MNIRFCTCGHTSLHHQRDSLERMACLDCECIEYDDYTEVNFYTHKFSSHLDLVPK